MFITALCVGIYLLYQIGESIAHLTSESCNMCHRPANLGGRFVTYVVGAAALEWLNLSVALLVPPMSFFLLASEFYRKQKRFAELDRLRKSAQLLDGGSFLLARSGWASDPDLLELIPTWITSRQLACLSLCATLILALNWIFPKAAGLILALSMICFSLCQGLQIPLGQFRQDGLVQWRYHVAQCTAALYQFACMASLRPVLNDWLPSVLICASGTLGLLFHQQNLENFRKRHALSYDNALNAIPLYCWQCAGIATALGIQLFGLDWYSMSLVVLFLLGGNLFLLYNSPRDLAIGKPL